MDSFEKWVISFIIVMIVAPLLGLGISEHNQRSCRMDLVKSGHSVDEIEKICK